ncbi:MAG: NrdH-redoxin [Candidatus Ryanbacteria bacterium]|nr:NrdH-redoxin [Candidatus Ryanbacteria bacterium]
MKKVEIYTTPSCVYCRKAKDMFQKHNIPYSEYNVMTDVTKRDEMIKRTGQMGVPVIEVDGTLIIGFDERRLREMLGIK